MAAEEAIRMVIQRCQRTVAKAEKPGVDVPLVALDTFALQVQLGLGGHDGLDIVGLGQGVHVHVIVDHQQAAFQIGAGKTVILHFLDAAVAGGISHEPFQYQPDSGFALAALADNEHHLLPLGAGNEAVARYSCKVGMSASSSSSCRKVSQRSGLAALGSYLTGRRFWQNRRLS